jgi:hypothetical protein
MLEVERICLYCYEFSETIRLTFDPDCITRARHAWESRGAQKKGYQF